MRTVGRLLIFDVTNGESFSRMKTLLRLNKADLQGNQNNGSRFFIIGDTSKVTENLYLDNETNKSSERRDRVVIWEEAADLANDYSCNYFEINLA